LDNQVIARAERILRQCSRDRKQPRPS
jgi:hypothetical protein